MTSEEQEELPKLLTLSPCLGIAYELKEELRNIYETITMVKMGLRNLQKWLASVRCLFDQIARTLAQHIQEICHYFINRTTRRVMEGLNTKIKLIIR